MNRKRNRGLSEEEQQLWQRVTETAKPIGPSEFQAKQSGAKPNTPPRPIQPFTITGRPQKPATTVDKTPSLADRITRQAVEMDAKAFKRMKAGKLKPEGRLDLHGMTLDQAHPRLNRFILDAYDDNKRLVLVITGKGKDRDDGGPIPTRLGVLRHQVPLWLRQFPLAQVVLQIDQSNQRHGGAGAYYVYLRRRR